MFIRVNFINSSKQNKEIRKMAEEIDDNEFYQQDFTTASEWEIFNARLEEQIHDWKLPFVEIGQPLTKNQLSLCEWIVTSESVYFADVELMLTRYCAVIPSHHDDPDTTLLETAHNAKLKHTNVNNTQAFIDLMSLENNYCIVDEKSDSNIHPLARWYGLRDFVVVSPAKRAIANESQIRIMLSSIHIAVADSNCEVPIFFQALETRQNVYSGICENRSTRLSFDIVHLQTAPPTCKYLSGLLDVFKGKIGIAYVDPVMVSVRLSYSLNKFCNAVYVSKRKFAFSDGSSDEEDDDDGNSGLNLLPFGVSIDPVTELILNCQWPLIPENIVIDSQNYSDFDPMLAPIWSIRGRFEQKSICYMSECMTEYLQLVEQRRTLTELLGDGYNLYGERYNTGDSNPLDLLTESKISTFTSVLPNFPNKPIALTKKSTQKTDGPLNEEQLMQMLYYMFPDAQADSPHNYEIPEHDHVIIYIFWRMAD